MAVIWSQWYNVNWRIEKQVRNICTSSHGRLHPARRHLDAVTWTSSPGRRHLTHPAFHSTAHSLYLSHPASFCSSYTLLVIAFIPMAGIRHTRHDLPFCALHIPDVSQPVFALHMLYFLEPVFDITDREPEQRSRCSFSSVVVGWPIFGRILGCSVVDWDHRSRFITPLGRRTLL